MKKSLCLLILLLCSSNIWSSELARFEENLERVVISRDKSEDTHQKIYEHTLNLGSYSLEYLWNRPNGNGLFLYIIKESWQVYLEESAPYRRDLKKSLDTVSSPKESLRALQLIERTQALYDTYMNNTELRHILLDQSNILNNSITEFFKEVLAHKVNEALPVLINRAKKLSEKEESASIILYKSSRKEDLSNFASLKNYFSDYVSTILSRTTSGLSSGFGAIAGPIEWGDGGQIRDDQVAKDKILRGLKPLDIIFEKKSYKLTDYTIPGYWGHNAVWIGTKDQLIEMGIWNARELDPFREQIEKGNSIFEMRKWGTTFAEFNKWMDLDDYAQVRVKGILKRSTKEILKVYKILAEQIGKNYDFSFNADTAFKITCSEIIYLSYGDVKWPLDYILGRNTITPNGMAEAIFYENSPLEYITFVKGDRKNGAKFYTKQEFGNLMNFTMLPNGSFVQRYKQCSVKHERNHRRAIKLVNKCINKTRTLRL
ncbi:YiiX/YebB-like N1pC/P60 family cysteine hydrolase [Halobacteriovorax sp. JY17]|uniref:YiiX/YebB-like N1pC/P60 family cysteine hydrolase n=1 Tax=Halobacteriovorax sp. JY17 TaxID=2014617 RepID=UPI000C4ECD05|nr:YiiX/YebB-like N1pC/P60 family cysteine hydrolase [Halobacteriovorax sp. JY17]PIK16219.1 MAG: hypothetical protein CES88_05650 [Halobacteriovorax sp. JY17]